VRSLSSLRAHAKQTIDKLLIPQRAAVQLASGAAASSAWRWATVISVGTSTFTAQLLDDSGNATGSQLTVNVAACTATGVTVTPTLATELPWIVAGQTVMIEQRTGYRAGWWLAGHNVTTCAGS